ncbi:condensation domain-containing protein [Alloiococcus sp. CFN-8]|uniref:condensation domain-containing protein n=1 Tax=Alloiococcus sp. CFN-8 TaxID=3416081 RepID=UPI003CF8E827
MERQLYALTASQNILYYSQKFTLHKQINNIPMLILMEEELDMDLFTKALLKGYERMDSLRIRLTKDGKEIKQYFMDSESPELYDLDMNGKSEEEIDKTFRKLASKRITYFDRPLSRAYLVKNCYGKSGLFFVISHLIIDSWGICVFFKDVISVYEALKKGEELPKAPYPYKPILEQDLNYKNTPQYLKDRAYWEKEFTPDNEPIFTSINGRGALEKSRKKLKKSNFRAANILTLRTKGEHLVKLFSKELVDRMKDFSVNNKISLQALVMLAFRTYLSKANTNESDVLFYTVLARRSALAEKNCGGSKVFFLPLRTNIAEDITFMEALDIITDKQSSVYRHSTIDPLEVIDITNKVYNLDPRFGYSTGSITFQPIPLKGTNGTKLHTKWYPNGGAPNIFYLTIMDDDGSGALRFYYEHQISQVKRETLEKLHSYMERIIEKGISNKEITIKELLEIEL